jgi:peptidoglycan/LPS O-acetylase OafA/YrhL
LANPYESSTSTSADGDTVRHDRIATARRRAQIAILLYLCILPLNIVFTSYGELVPYDGLPLVILVFLIFGFAAISVYALSSRLRTKPTAILMTAAALIPLLGFVVLLYATTLKPDERKHA